MKKQSSKAITFIKELSTTHVIDVSNGKLNIVLNSEKFELENSEIVNPKTLFYGGENWLDSHVPDQDRNSEAVREYILEYVRSMYKDIVEEWEM